VISSLKQIDPATHLRDFLSMRSCTHEDKSKNQAKEACHFPLRIAERLKRSRRPLAQDRSGPPQDFRARQNIDKSGQP
jgi:hypothetical protein